MTNINNTYKYILDRVLNNMIQKPVEFSKS